MNNLKNKIINAFISKASEILGDTNSGLTGSQIIKHCNDFAFKWDVDIPFTSQPFKANGSMVNKSSALYGNLIEFNSIQKYRIIKYLCELRMFKESKEVEKLKNTLIERYGYLVNEVNYQISQYSINKSKYSLSDYSDAKKIFKNALEKINKGNYERNILDDLRLCLESLIKQILGNQKSLENQKILEFLEQKGISKEISNMLNKILNYYLKYQNNNVKHNDSVKKEEVKIVFEITTCFIGFLVTLDKK